MFIYNLSLILLFYTLFQFASTKHVTTSALGNLGMNNILTKFLIITLFSMAGVPPFWGFFSKLFIFNLLSASNFFVLFAYFFILTFLGLYFYIQNIRFLNSTNPSSYDFVSDFNLRVTPIYYYTAFTITFLLLFGFIFTEDLLFLMK